jgi:hypothetical protein
MPLKMQAGIPNPNANAARFRQCLQARRYVDSVTKSVIWLGDYVTEIDAHTEACSRV